MVTRTLQELLSKQKKSVLLLGPRQVGKSTLLRQLKPDLVINLAREKEFLDHSVRPELLEELIQHKAPSTGTGTSSSSRAELEEQGPELEELPRLLSNIPAAGCFFIRPMLLIVHSRLLLGSWMMLPPV